MMVGRRWTEADFVPQRRQEMSRTAGGAAIVADLGPVLWRASCRSFPLKRDGADALMADFETLGGALRTFWAVPVLRPVPASIAGDTATDLQGITVASIADDRSGLSLAGLPADFVLTAGDWLSIATAAGGREVVRLAEGGAADAAGLSPVLACYPTLRPGVVVGQVVRARNPRIEMRLEPESLLRERAGGAWFTVAFSAWQVIR